MRISGTLLKVGARMDLTLEQIGFILCRPDQDEDQNSLLEDLVLEAELSVEVLDLKMRRSRRSCEQQNSVESV